MKVIVDNKIPFIREAIESIADEVVYAEGKDFTPQLIHDADALIIRTRTRCDRALLEGSCVSFIATATIGHDHIDPDYCREAGIEWANAPGCNASSVAQYMHSALLLLQMQKDCKLTEMTMGIVGVGNVGSKVAEVACDMGMSVLENDPPRAGKEGKELFRPLEELARECAMRHSSARCRRNPSLSTRRAAKWSTPPPCSVPWTRERCPKPSSTYGRTNPT